MTPESEGPRTRRAPVAQCRLCSAVCSIEAPTTDALRLSLRAFMADHRHDGFADIVIDISDDDVSAASPDDRSTASRPATGSADADRPQQFVGDELLEMTVVPVVQL